MNILAVGFYPPNGAVPDLFRQTVQHLAQVAQVSVLSQPDPQLDTRNLVATHTIAYSRQTPFSFLSPSSWRTLRLLAQQPFDVVFYYTQHILQVPVSLVMGHIPQVMWWHEPPGQARGRLLNRVMYAAHDAVLTRRANTIIIACESMRTLVPQSLAPKIRVVPLPFNERFASADPAPSPLAADLIFWGKIEPFKGLDVLAQALEQLYADDKVPTLSVIGPGDVVRSCPRLLALAQAHPDRIRIVNEYVPHRALSAAIRDSRVVVMPYRIASGTSTLPIAYHHAKPVIASHVGSFIDWVRHGEIGLLVDPDDVQGWATAILQLVNHQTSVWDIGQRAYSCYLSQFTQSAVTQSLEEIFRHVAQSSIVL